jgi:hypothetical protein
MKTIIQINDQILLLEEHVAKCDACKKFRDIRDYDSSPEQHAGIVMGMRIALIWAILPQDRGIAPSQTID